MEILRPFRRLFSNPEEKLFAWTRVVAGRYVHGGEGVVLDSKYNLKVDLLKHPGELEVEYKKKRRIMGD